MKKPFIIAVVLVVVVLNVYASGNRHKRTNALAAQATTTEPEVVHQASTEESHDAAHHVTTQTAGETAHAEQQEDHTLPEVVHEEAGHPSADSMAGDHGVPAKAAAVTNPILASDESISRGAAIFSQSCAACHGAIGEGDGPGAATLNPKPADLHADHVQGNSDGAMFWIISQGREGTAMPAWNTILTEEQRWDVVNFLRTFHEEE